MTPKLSILICTRERTKSYFLRLIDLLEAQLGSKLEMMFTTRTYIGRYNGHLVEILFNEGEIDSIGTKRNSLLDRASGDNLAFIDDDDLVSLDYFKLLFEGIEKGVDCCSLKGIITEDGQNPLLFEHSIRYTTYRTIADSVHGEVRYERYPNHLNCIRADIAKQFRFPEKNHGEDTEWATQIYNSGLLKTEHYIPEVIYYYEYRSNK